MKTVLDTKQIGEVLTRGVEKIYPDKKTLEEKLLSGKRIKLYCGYDPSGPSLHLGHMITLRKLGEFQKLGHEVIMLVGDFTGMIGDPTDKMATRKKLTREEVIKNSKNYKKIASKFLSFSGQNPAKILYNSKWQDKLSFKDLIELASNFTVQQMLNRDMFEKRFYGEVQCQYCSNVFAHKTQDVFYPSNQDFEEGTMGVKYILGICPKCQKQNNQPRIISLQKPIYLHEFLYPLAQAYDSVVMDVDLEVGGNDQVFNMLRGRDLLKALRNKEKCVLGLKLLIDSEGKKMGKSEGNMVELDELSNQMFGKIMSWSDSLIIPGLELLTEVSELEIKDIEDKIKNNNLNPKEAKTRLAKEIIKLCHSEKEAQESEKEFNKIHRDKELPSEIETIAIPEDRILLIDIASPAIINSRSEARRIIEQGGIKINGEVQNDWKKEIPNKKGKIIQVGKRIFKKII